MKTRSMSEKNSKKSFQCKEVSISKRPRKSNKSKDRKRKENLLQQIFGSRSFQNQTGRGPISTLEESVGKTLEENIRQLPKTQLQKLVMNISKKYPSLVSKIIKELNRYRSRESPNWCSCNHCRAMPTKEERVCCEKSSQNCLSLDKEFESKVFEETNNEPDCAFIATIDELHHNLRKDAYSRFVSWQYGKLGKSKRKVIPSCCVWRVRDDYPDTFESYTGFKAQYCRAKKVKPKLKF